MAEEAEVTAQEELLERIPEDGSAVGNAHLIDALGREKDFYYQVRDALEDEGRIRRWKGRGGTVKRVLAATEPSDEEPAPTELAQLYEEESSLYEPMSAVIRGEWARDRREDLLAVEVTGHQGRRQTGGKWTRPDIIAVSVKTWDYVPGRHLEVFTFEVKLGRSLDISAVYEALAHLRSATHAYVLVHIPDADADDLQEVLDDVCQVARSHGVGVIAAGDPGDYETWDAREEATRHEPDPGRLDELIRKQLPETARGEIRRSVR